MQTSTRLYYSIKDNNVNYLLIPYGEKISRPKTFANFQISQTDDNLRNYYSHNTCSWVWLVYDNLTIFVDVIMDPIWKPVLCKWIFVCKSQKFNSRKRKITHLQNFWASKFSCCTVKQKINPYPL